MGNPVLYSRPPPKDGVDISISNYKKVGLSEEDLKRLGQKVREYFKSIEGDPAFSINRDKYYFEDPWF